MTQLYSADIRLLAGHSQSARMWADIRQLIVLATPMFDRTGRIAAPFDFAVHPRMKMPRDTSGAKSYEECCEARVTELLALQDQLRKPIYLLYSGGIDSTLMLVMFMRRLSDGELRDRIVVALTHDSIMENASFYYRFIRRKCTIASAEQIPSLLDWQKIVVGGEHNDQLMGSDLIGGAYRDGDIGFIHEPYSGDQVVRFFVSQGMPEDAAKAWFSVLNESAADAPTEVKTFFQLLWWLNFNFKWQAVFFRIPLRGDFCGNRLDATMFDDHFHHFYSTADFQKWSMACPDQKIRDTWPSYKFIAKELIYRYNKDAGYRDLKVKRGSIQRLFHSKKAAAGITSKLELLGSLRPEDYAIADNAFAAAAEPPPDRARLPAG